jgi:hypothetical protein
LDVTEHHGVRATGAGEFDGLLKQDLSQIAVMVGLHSGTGSASGQRMSFLSMLTIITFKLPPPVITFD